MAVSTSPESKAAPKSIALITMSTRTPRVGPSVASFIHSILSATPQVLSPESATVQAVSSQVNSTTTAASTSPSSITLKELDLASFPLPVYNEPFIVPAMLGAPGGPTQFTNPVAVSWSNEIKSHDGYVLVCPEYNYSASGGTKNAIDYLKNEWNGKPVMIVTYGVKGGNLAGEHLRGILTGMGLKVVQEKVELPFSSENKTELGYGADALGATLQGALGECTRKEWLERKGEVEKAWESFVGLVFEETDGEKKE
ncbi:putative NAD(P)H-dependent FMN reductase LOT6 [Rhypophila decipiens]|uniref:NAD(P)H-dependent FMN reductase LOT6 n=1 Tax=Rhypophila decipiens TaxID=261697 RepID=A0AAN6Y888_9PEZI|nr:putative NAD(P)H-dependent FMN reductase LOT6 [Rhypophila decipiens]